jgi:hypothetical protein
LHKVFDSNEGKDCTKFQSIDLEKFECVPLGMFEEEYVAKEARFRGGDGTKDGIRDVLVSMSWVWADGKESDIFGSEEIREVATENKMNITHKIKKIV